MYPNGVIPVSDQDPGFTGLIKNLPMPNVNPAAEGQGYNWVDVLTVNQNMWQSSSRVDWNINDNTKLFVRYNIQKELQPFPIMLWWRNPGAVPLPTPINGQNVSDSISTNFTKVLSPTMTNEFIFGYTYVNFPNVYADYDKMTKTANKYPYTGIFPGQDPKIPAYWTWSAPIAGVYSTGGFDPTLFATKYLWNVNDNVSKVLGTHTLKFGGYWGYIVNEQPGNDVSNGQQIWDTWADTSSGNALGDILRGNAVQFNQATKQINRNEGYNEFAFFGQDSWKISPRVTLEYGLRIQHLQPWSARNGLGMAAWVPQDYNPNAPSSALSGVEWTAMNSKIPLSGAASRALFYAPRVGFAWDIFGKGKTVLRGGYGMFWYHDPQLGANAMDLPAGVRSTAVCCGVFMPYVDSLAGSNVPPVFNGNTMDSTDDRQPKTQTYSFTVSQRLKWRTMLEVAYVGSDSTNLINGNSFLNINQVPVGAMLNNPTGDTNAYRRLSNYQDLNVYNHRQYSNYNSLQVMATKQSGWANFTLAYTWSKAMGIIDTPINQLYGMMSESYAPLSSDRTQILAASYVINVPDLVKGGGNAFMKGVANGWQISGIVQANSGINIWQNSGSGNFYTAVDLPQGGTLSSQAVTGTNAWILSPLVTCNPRANLKQNQYINGSCFAPPVAGQNGQFGVNGPTVMPYFRGPGFFDTDLSVFKNFKMGEIRNLQFRASAYNLPNHPNRSFVSGDQNLRLNFAADGHITNPNFGYAGYTVGKRIIQLGVRFIF
jgi:hypothetical protein